MILLGTKRPIYPSVFNELPDLWKNYYSGSSPFQSLHSFLLFLKHLVFVGVAQKQNHNHLS